MPYCFNLALHTAYPYSIPTAAGAVNNKREHDQQQQKPKVHILWVMSSEIPIQGISCLQPYRQCRG